MKYLFKKIFHRYILKTRIPTVYLRGRISEEREKLIKKYSAKLILGVSQATSKMAVANTEKKNVILEIGFGNGSHILELARQNKDSLVFGVEMFREGLVRTLEKVIEGSMSNIFLLDCDIRKVIDKIPKQSLGSVYILFPDPWPKKKHNKRRLLKKSFFEDLLTKIKIGGEVVIATDWAEYGYEIQQFLEELQKENKGRILELNSDRQVPIKETTFAVRALKDKREIYIVKFVKT